MPINIKKDYCFFCSRAVYRNCACNGS